ncbi:MAG: hypothetical protein MAG715_00622 [Methanonatronarchaeales archaeon]|nr:hypothetical protein [Methanonatronarchaeales archaeon]
MAAGFQAKIHRCPENNGYDEDDIVPFRSEAEVKEVVEEGFVELIEAKRKVNRPVFGQVVAGRDMFKRHYGSKVDRSVALCNVPDPAMEWVCGQNGVGVELRGLE